MSSLRAIELSTEPVPVAETQAYLRPRPRPEVAPWKHDFEAAIHVIGRLGLGPIPTVLLGFGLLLSMSLRTG